jgi:hypothetical protein
MATRNQMTAGLRAAPLDKGTGRSFGLENKSVQVENTCSRKLISQKEGCDRIFTSPSND